jgi:hypothetical protein
MLMMRCFLMAALLLVFLRAGAQAPLYKCELNGKVSYNSVACPNGAALPSLPDPAPAGKVEGAGTSTARLKAMADQMMRERQKREAKEEHEQKRAGQRAAVLRRQCDKLRLHKKWSDEDAASATAHAPAPARAKAQRHARRQAEQLALACPR